MANRYKKGSTIVLSLDVTRDGAAVDPNTVVCRVLRPDKTEVAPPPTVTHPEAGEYVATVIADQEGTWRYRFEGAGNQADGADEDAFIVDNTEFA